METNPRSPFQKHTRDTQAQILRDSHRPRSHIHTPPADVREHHAIHIEDLDHSRPRAALAPLLLVHQRTVTAVSKMVTEVSHSTRLTQVLAPASAGLRPWLLRHINTCATASPSARGWVTGSALPPQARAPSPPTPLLPAQMSNETPLIPHRHLCPAASSTRALARCRMSVMAMQ